MQTVPTTTPTPTMATARATALGQTLSLGSVTNAFDWVVERFGPALSEILLELLMKKSQHGIRPTAQDALGSFDIKNIAVLLLERFGTTVLQKAADALEQRTDLISKLVGNALRQYSQQVLVFVLDWLKTAEGDRIMREAVAEVIVRS